MGEGAESECGPLLSRSGSFTPICQCPWVRGQVTSWPLLALGLRAGGAGLRACGAFSTMDRAQKAEPVLQPGLCKLWRPEDAVKAGAP